MLAAQVLIALVSLMLAPVFGLFAPGSAFFGAAFGLAGLTGATLRKTPWVNALCTFIQVLAFTGLVFVAIQDTPAPTDVAGATAELPNAAAFPANARSAP